MSDQQRLTGEERAKLVAYLDGELPDGQARAIATKLEVNTTARYEVQSLERTWELLDFLARPKVSPELTARTLTLATQLDNAGARLFTESKSLARRALQVAASLVAVAAALGVGYAAARWVWLDPTARLAQHLTIAEHLDEYLDAGSFEYLRLLEGSPHAFEADDP